MTPAPPPGTTAPADLLVTHGRVVTVDGADTVHPDGAVAVADGAIVAVGPSGDVAAGVDAATTIDAGGGLVLPGLVNSHTHLAMTLFRGVADDLDLQGFLERVWAHEADVVAPDTVRLGVTAAITESLLGGVTTALDMYFHHDVAADVAEQIGFRLLGGPTLVDFPGSPPDAFDRLADEAEQWLATHRPGLELRLVLSPHSTYTLDRHQLEVARRLATEHAALVHVHAAENAGEMAQVRDLHDATPVEVLADAGLLGPDTLLAHAVHLDDRDLERVAASGAGVAHNPASNLKLASGIARVPDLVAAGVPVGLGTDGPASSNDLDLWMAIRLAGLVHKVHHDDPTVLPARAVLRMATIEGARALGLDDRIGSLEAGKRADLIVLDPAAPALAPIYDAYSALAYAAGRGDVRHVVVDGRVVVRDGGLRDVDRADVAARLQRIADGRS